MMGSLFFLCCAPPSNEFEHKPSAISLTSNPPAAAPVNDPNHPNAPKITNVSTPSVPALQCDTIFNIAVSYLDADSTVLHIRYTMSYNSHEILGEKNDNTIEPNSAGTINVPLFVDCNTLNTSSQQDVRIQFVAVDSSNKNSASAEVTVRVQK